MSSGNVEIMDCQDSVIAKDDIDKIEAISENFQDDWENDPANPRNWTPAKKWTATSIASPPLPPSPFILFSSWIFHQQVSLYTFVSPQVGSAMMAPGLPEVATKYGITNSTVLALTLSIYLISFGIAVSPYFTFLSSTYTNLV